MGKFSVARQLAGKMLVTNRGESVGRLVDFSVNEVTGKILNLVAEPNPDSGIAKRMKKEEGMLLVPYSAVLAVSDFVILDEKALV